MAKKGNWRKSQSGSKLLERAQRELAKGNAKTAVKDAEACFRKDPSPEHRQFLEKAYVSRVEQLHRLRLTAESRAALQKLLDLKPTAPETLQQIPRLQVIVGDTRVDAGSVLEREPGLLITLADQAVLDSRAQAPSQGGVADQVARIRAALAAVERGEDEKAAEMLHDLPRRSPLGDWKLFVRGLSAFYQGNEERAQANWQRLDTERPACRIAQTLLVVAGQIRPDAATADISVSLPQLEAHIQTDPAGLPLKELAEHWRKGDWKAFFREYRQFRQRFAKSHPQLLKKIVDLAWKRFVHDERHDNLDRLEAIGPSPPFDPHWYRVSALDCEERTPWFTPALERAWQGYLDSLEEATDMREEDRAIAAGLIHYRLAERMLRSADQLDRMSRFPWTDFDADDGEELRRKAAQRLRRAIESCPNLKDAYRDLAELHEDWKELAKSAVVLRRLLAVDPDDFDAHVWLANYHLSKNEPAESSPHVDAAARIRPRDRQCSELRWNQRLASIRALVMRRKFNEARRQVDETAAALAEGREEPFVLDVMRAAIEWKSKNEEAAEQHLAAALAQAGEPAVVWMAMSGAAAEYRLPSAVKKDFDNRFKAAVQTAPTSRTAGLLARRVSVLRAGKRNYTGRYTQERLILKYLERSRRVAWQEADLQAVCDMLETLPRSNELMSALVAVGVRMFPDNAWFQFWRGNCEISLGSFRCNLTKAIAFYRRALELARVSKEPDDRDIVPLAEHALSAAYELQERSTLFGAARDRDDDEDYVYDDSEDDEYDDECEDDDGPSEWERQMNMFDGNDDDDDDADEPFDARKALAEIEKMMPPEILEALRREMAKMGLGPT